MAKTSEIFFRIDLDEDNLPARMEWDASESDSEKAKECKTLMISIWDKEQSTLMGIDLWTKDMLVEEMNILYHQNFQKLADTYLNATKNEEIHNLILDFADKFAKAVNLFGDDHDHEHHHHEH